MKLTVIWVRRAEDDLAAIWLAASDRNAVTQAARRINLRLESDQLNEGESRLGNQRVLFEIPLGALFEVEEATHTVWVLQVWRSPTRGARAGQTEPRRSSHAGLPTEARNGCHRR